MEEVLKLIGELSEAEARRFTIFRYTVLMSILGIIGSSLLIYQYTGGDLGLSLLSGLWISAVLILVCLSVYLSHLRISLSIDRINQMTKLEHMSQSQGDIYVTLASALLMNDTLSEAEAKLILNVIPDIKSRSVLSKLLKDRGIINNDVRPVKKGEEKEDDIVVS